MLSFYLFKEYRPKRLKFTYYLHIHPFQSPLTMLMLGRSLFCKYFPSIMFPAYLKAINTYLRINWECSPSIAIASQMNHERAFGDQSTSFYPFPTFHTNLTEILMGFSTHVGYGYGPGAEWSEREMAKEKVLAFLGFPHNIVKSQKRKLQWPQVPFVHVKGILVCLWGGLAN